MKQPVSVEELSTDQWVRYRDIRLAALENDGHAFGGNLDAERLFTEAEWRAKVKEAEERVRIAEQQAAEATAKVEIKVVEKTKVIKQRAETIYRDVEREIVKYNNTCVIPPKFIELHNQAAEHPFPAKESK